MAKNGKPGCGRVGPVKGRSQASPSKVFVGRSERGAEGTSMSSPHIEAPGRG